MRRGGATPSRGGRDVDVVEVEGVVVAVTLGDHLSREEWSRWGGAQ